MLIFALMLVGFDLFNRILHKHAFSYASKTEESISSFSTEYSSLYPHSTSHLPYPQRQAGYIGFTSLAMVASAEELHMDGYLLSTLRRLAGTPAAFGSRFYYPIARKICTCNFVARAIIKSGSSLEIPESCGTYIYSVLRISVLYIHPGHMIHAAYPWILAHQCLCLHKYVYVAICMDADVVEGCQVQYRAFKKDSSVAAADIEHPYHRIWVHVLIEVN
ncbi:hypothetical protein BDBG_03539 [Blastomyces gilchristii SLH14081]|uniref:Uncharacterized protein n=1 Tax=Blastomyces gilchristii (strain SLH14081) TaxID=559298 RepID=A0A179UHL5_BLAGS|nr:uncharacterized protein BDBG_03539 [Blastomyces gilchristii SLH14081]OAT07484.1 hypothetical protein BDBG_03539 [Blastomyces gilchristii SLH14081]